MEAGLAKNTESCRQQQKLRFAGNVPCPPEGGGLADNCILDFQFLELKIHFCCFKSLSLWSFGLAAERPFLDAQTADTAVLISDALQGASAWDSHPQTGVASHYLHSKHDQEGPHSLYLDSES